ncbi:MAG TPA: cell division protein FtsQ/DivIB [Terriglobia bacterium]|nr:cell division protein FtsQ/DivIB [Terriglobia bacterium]
MNRNPTDEENLAVQALDGEEESPYLRRQKAVTVRRRPLWGRRWVLFFLVVAPVGIASYFLTVFVLSSPRFELHSADDIQVIAYQFVAREDVASALGLPLHAGNGPGLKVWRLSLEAQRKQVEGIAWVRSAALTRVFPNRLVVHVFERTPVAYANVGGHVSLVDSDGVLLDKPESAFFDFPVITGLNSNAGSDDCRNRIALYQDFMRQLGEEIAHSGWVVSEADLSDGDDLKALLVQGRETLQVHFGHENFIQHFHTFLALLPELRKANAPLDSVDLRYRNQVVVNPQGRTPAPPAGDVEPSQTLKE